MGWLTSEEIEYTCKVAAEIGRDPEDLVREGEQAKADAYRQAHAAAQQTMTTMRAAGRGRCPHPGSPAAQPELEAGG
jgi:hypothetical protein